MSDEDANGLAGCGLILLGIGAFILMPIGWFFVFIGAVAMVLAVAAGRRS